VGQSGKKQKMKLAGHEELVMILLKWFQQMRYEKVPNNGLSLGKEASSNCTGNFKALST